MSVAKNIFGTTTEGHLIYSYEIKNKMGNAVRVLDYGAILQSVELTDGQGKKRDVVLAYKDLKGYETETFYLGATTGRSCNRIEGGTFVIDGIRYQMEQNEDENSLHSGPDGYNRRIWQVTETTEQSVTFTLTSPNGDQGFPGTFSVSVTYTWTDANELKINYQGVSDEDTVANLTNHSYFNLNGHESGNVLEHQLQIMADGFTPVKDSHSIPTGEIVPVEGTPMDFRQMHTIGERIDEPFQQLVLTSGYDHNYVLNGQVGKLRKIATAIGDQSKIQMDVYTDLPGVQFYAGNFVNLPEAKDHASYGKRQGFCLETQFYPNSINEPAFPSPLLKKGEEYHTITIYHFI